MKLIQSVDLESLAQDHIIVMVGCSGSGKSTIANIVSGVTGAFVLSSDDLRVILSGDMANQDVNGQVFYLLHKILESRCKYKQPTIVDTTALRARDRAKVLGIIRDSGMKALALLVEASGNTCKERQMGRDLQVPDFVVDKHQALYDQAKVEIINEGFDLVVCYNSETGEDFILQG